MKTNFEIDENYAVILNGVHIDLHNNFEFRKISEFNNTIQIEFTKSSGTWISENEFKKLIFSHKKVSFVNKIIGDNSEFPEDENKLSGITFFPKTSRQINDNFMNRKHPNQNDDIIYLFENGKIFRLNSEQIELITEK